jgi:hypothetical protein
MRHGPRHQHWHDTWGHQPGRVVPLGTVSTTGPAAAPHEGRVRCGVADRGGEGRRRAIEAERPDVALMVSHPEISPFQAVNRKNN